MLQKRMNNVFVDSHFKNSAIYKARELIDQENGKVIFGGKKLFIQRCQGKISRNEFQIEKLMPIISIGEANERGNRKFTILENGKILFKAERSVHIELTLPFLKKNLKKELEKLRILQDAKSVSITFQLDCKNIYLSYDDALVNELAGYAGKNGRIMSIDMNPNYIGYSIIDWKNEDEWKIVSKGLFDVSFFSIKSKELKRLKYTLRQLGKDGDERRHIILDTLKHLNGQRDHETIEIAIKLFNLFKGFNCNILGIEKLNIKSKNNNHGKNYNRLVNNEWLIRCLTNQLEKRVDRIRARTIKVLPGYSSFIGNLLYRDTGLPDPLLASIEVNRRAFEFYKQYIEKTKHKEKIIMFPNFEKIKGFLVKPLEGFDVKIDSFKSWKQLYGYVKNAGVKYRVPLESIQNSGGFSKTCIKYNVVLFSFK
ncbi:MAG TPA: hypothetical protein VKM55_25675 [Candidatus Lokiarchaeia archaeon]|nr:hypothetical protein [Candidatus Lokiarchaeia archaeon]